MLGTDVRNRCSEQTVVGTMFRANTASKTLIRVYAVDPKTRARTESPEIKYKTLKRVL